MPPHISGSLNALAVLRAWYFLVLLCATAALLALPHKTEAADSYTKLLLHADGSDGSTTFLDSSPFKHAVTTDGETQVDISQSKFGGASSAAGWER